MTTKAKYTLSKAEVDEVEACVKVITDGMTTGMGAHANDFINNFKDLVYKNAFYSSTELDIQSGSTIGKTLQFADYAIFKENSKDQGQPLILPSVHIIENNGEAKSTANHELPYADPARLELWNMIFLFKNEMVKFVTNGRNLRHALGQITAENLQTGMTEWDAANGEVKKGEESIKKLAEKAKSKNQTAFMPDDLQREHKLPVANIISQPSITKLFNMWFMSHINKFVDRFIGHDGSFVDPSKPRVRWTKLATGETIEVTDPKLVALITWAHSLNVDKDGKMNASGTGYTDFLFKTKNFFRGYFFTGSQEVYEGKKRVRKTKKGDKDSTNRKKTSNEAISSDKRQVGIALPAGEVALYIEARKILGKAPEK